MPPRIRVGIIITREGQALCDDVADSCGSPYLIARFSKSKRVASQRVPAQPERPGSGGFFHTRCDSIVLSSCRVPPSKIYRVFVGNAFCAQGTWVLGERSRTTGAGRSPKRSGLSLSEEVTQRSMFNRLIYTHMQPIPTAGRQSETTEGSAAADQWSFQNVAVRCGASCGIKIRCVHQSQKSFARHWCNRMPTIWPWPSRIGRRAPLEYHFMLAQLFAWRPRCTNLVERNATNAQQFRKLIQPPRFGACSKFFHDGARIDLRFVLLWFGQWSMFNVRAVRVPVPAIFHWLCGCLSHTGPALEFFVVSTPVRTIANSTAKLAARSDPFVHKWLNRLW